MSDFDKNDVFYFPEKITYDFDYQEKISGAVVILPQAQRVYITKYCFR